MVRISLFVSLCGPQLVTFVRKFRLKLQDCMLLGKRPQKFLWLYYINTTELLVRMFYICGPHLEYVFPYSFGSPKRLEIRKLQAA